MKLIDFTDLPIELSILIHSFNQPNKYETCKKRCIERLQLFIHYTQLAQDFPITPITPKDLKKTVPSNGTKF